MELVKLKYLSSEKVIGVLTINILGKELRFYVFVDVCPCPTFRKKTANPKNASSFIAILGRGLGRRVGLRGVVWIDFA